MDAQLLSQLDSLREFTKECRIDMHEPDEQGISARIVGDHLDNACGEDISDQAIEGGYQELVVILKKGGREIYKINLATLIALARFEK